MFKPDLFRSWVLLFVVLSFGCANAHEAPPRVDEFQQMMRARQEVTAADQDVQAWDQLQVSTINLGMLEILMMGRKIAYVPYYVERKKILEKALSDHIEERSPDIIFIQELWAHTTSDNAHEDFDAVKKVANQFAYRMALTEPEELQNHGLQILFREDLGGDDFETSFDLFKDQAGKNIRSGLESMGGTQRGLLWAQLNFRGREILAVTTHLTAGLAQNQIRLQQIRSLHANIDSLSAKTETSLVLMGADLNISDIHVNVPEGQEQGWNENTKAFQEFLMLTNATDSFLAVKDAREGLTQDRATNVLTAESPSTKLEPDQRLDYIFVLDGGAYEAPASFFVESSDLAFQQIYELESGVKSPISDHWGVSTKFRLSSK